MSIHRFTQGRRRPPEDREAVLAKYAIVIITCLAFIPVIYLAGLLFDSWIRENACSTYARLSGVRMDVRASSVGCLVYADGRWQRLRRGKQ